MIYHVTDEFTKLAVTTGTIQNSSCVYPIEISDNAEADSGILLYPLNKISFSGTTLYIRCAYGGSADVRVVPFVIGTVGSASSSETSDPTDETDANAVVNTMWASDDSVDDADVTIQQIWDSDDSGETGDGFSDDLQAMFG